MVFITAIDVFLGCNVLIENQLLFESAFVFNDYPGET